VSGRVFLLPDLGEGLADAEVVQWRVRVGDEVGVDQVVVEVETAKAAVEVPCPFAGRVGELHAVEGERLPVGRPLLTVVPTDVVAPGDTGEPGDAPDVFAAHREEERGGSGNVLIGYGTGAGPAPGPGRSGRAARRRRAIAAPGVRVAVPLSAVAPVPEPAPLAAELPAAPRFVSPVVRRLAAERGLDPAVLRGSGPGGVIVRADVEAVAVPPAPAAPGPAPAPPATARPGPDGEVRIPLRGVRRATAELLTRSRREIPEVTVWVDVDATGLLEARSVLAAAHPDHQVGVLPLLARITVHALGRFPELNSRVEGDEIVQSRRVHLGVAAQTDRGLVVPVLHDASSLDLLGLADGLGGLTGRARAGTLAPSELTGGTFTLNNYGVFGVDGSTPIINHPQAAILGIGRIVDRPWVVDGSLAVRKVAQLGLAFDHRVCDGAVAGGFLRLVADCVERPTLLLATV